MLQYINSGEIWQGEVIDGLRHPKDIETKWTIEELQAIGLKVYVPDPADVPPLSSRDVDLERETRINDGFIYLGHEYQTDPSSRENIAGAAALSLASMIADPNGDLGLRWADPDEDFVWIATDNTAVPMTAAECQAFCQAAMQYKSNLIKAARALKDQPIPQDYADDKWWPSRLLA